jgi:acyl-[acyl carrier protein]--UDP-N-acetylglucosamine O-acyltransferase
VRNIHPTAIIHEKVQLPESITIGPFCIIGQPCDGEQVKNETIIGESAVIRSHSVIYEGNRIGQFFSTGHHVCIRENNVIGNNVSVGTLSCIEHRTLIEDGVRIHSQVFVPEFTILREKAWLGPNVVLTNARYPRSPDVKDKLQGPVIEKNAILGANTTVLPGIHIGVDSLIGSGSLVTKSVEGKLCSVRKSSQN